MAQYNKTLGRFNLTGIAPAPRGVPQIEVSFDIDANGIVKVSAKDLGTGNQQDITITASSNLSDEDIDRAVKEAEKYAEEDKKRKEEVEIRNNAESLVYQAEKTLKDAGDKIDAADADDIKAEVEKVRTALTGTDSEAIKAASELLTQKFYAISEKLYKQANPQGAPQGEPTGDAGSAGGQDYYESYYREVDNENN